MNCDDFLTSIRTGGIRKRLAARWHAARCRRCATLLDGLLRMESELARTDPLTSAQRRLWERAITVQTEERSRVPIRMPVLAAALAATLVLGATVFVWQWTGGSRHEPEPVVQTNPETRPPDHGWNKDLSEQLAQIETDVDALSAELDELSRKAALLSARQQINELISQL